jgi:hypothetical protein
VSCHYQENDIQENNSIAFYNKFGNDERHFATLTGILNAIITMMTLNIMKHYVTAELISSTLLLC